ncbi:MAG: TraB/GumN family protein [Spirochaetaceae bacterium]|nr:TraB/GumN family protein [Spirochaetaceae bacterium]HPG24944.1 TraB/GumN family protein [Myxococcota bacterium]
MTQDPEALSDGTPSPPTCDPSGSATSSGNATDSGDVHLVEVGGRTLWLVGTAHVSQRSVDLVREVIERERPDAVCIELDAGRYEALSQAKRFEEQDLREVLRKKQLATLMLNLILASYQRRLGLKLGVAPGSELMEAARVAESLGIPTALCDRDVRITLRRAWQSISWWQRVKLVAELAASLFDSPEVSEEELARIRDQDVVTEVMNELGRMMPDLKRVLIDERDAYLAHEILETPGRRIVAVVGAGHIEGMKARLEREERTDLEAIKAIPPASPVWKVVGWSIPLVIVGSIVAIAFTQGPEAAGENALLWFLANAIPSGLGALLALGHPLTIAAAALSAPFTSLTPLIGAGYVAAFAQLWTTPPRVSDFGSVGDDLAVPSRWWKSRLMRIFLVFVLSTLGSLIGTYTGGFGVLANLVEGGAAG